jgi:hypothetical protein
LIGVISFGGRLCYTGPCSSSLALVCVIGLFRCLGSLEGVCPFELSLFLLFCLLFAPPHIRLSCLLCASFRWAGYFCFEIGSRFLATILFGLIWDFSGVPGVRGALLFWS